MLSTTVPHGHRYHQLRRAVDRLDGSGRLLDLGAGSGWLAAAWPGEAMALDVRAPASPAVPWVTGSNDTLPFVAASFDRVALLAALGACRTDRTLAATLADVRRVLRPRGRLLVLASARKPLADAIAPHRVRTGWRWRSFAPATLVGACEAAGLRVLTVERYGGARTLVVDWASTLLAPVLRGDGRTAMLDRIGEWDGSEFVAPREHGRYIYLTAERP